MNYDNQVNVLDLRLNNTVQIIINRTIKIAKVANKVTSIFFFFFFLQVAFASGLSPSATVSHGLSSIINDAQWRRVREFRRLISKVTCAACMVPQLALLVIGSTAVLTAIISI